MSVMALKIDLYIVWAKKIHFILGSAVTKKKKLSKIIISGHLHRSQAVVSKLYRTICCVHFSLVLVFLLRTAFFQTILPNHHKLCIRVRKNA